RANPSKSLAPDTARHPHGSATSVSGLHTRGRNKMLTPERAEEIFSKLRRFSQADEIELLISGTHTALTRFANNTIHQNVAEKQYHISVRTSFGGRTARASTNKEDDDSLRRVVRSAEDL